MFICLHDSNLKQRKPLALIPLELREAALYKVCHLVRWHFFRACACNQQSWSQGKLGEWSYHTHLGILHYTSMLSFLQEFKALIKLSVSIRTERKRRRKEGIEGKNGKEEVKLSLFQSDMILYKLLKILPKKKMLELINKFSKVLGDKINVQEFVVGLPLWDVPS